MKKVAIYNPQNNDINISGILSGIAEIVDTNPNYVITFGGDGTFLDATQKFGLQPLYIPINSGTLGFYTSWTLEDIHYIKNILNGNHHVVKAPTLNVVCYYRNEIKQEYYVINEAAIINSLYTQRLNVFINNAHFEKFIGTGVTISTPTGSTGYNKSLGGAVIPPYLSAFQLTEIAGIDNVKFRSLGNSIVFSDSDLLTLKPHQESTFSHATMTLDRRHVDLSSIDRLEFTLSEQKVNIVVRTDNTFWKRVQRSFLG